MSESRVLSMRSEDVVGTLDQQTSEVNVAGLGDAELRITISGLTAFRTKPEVTAHITALFEPFLAPQGQHKGEGRDLANPVHLQQGLRLRILRPSELLELTIVVFDLQRHLGDLLEHRAKRLRQSGRHRSLATLRKAAGR